MRRLRLLLLVFFLAVFAVFMASNIREYLTSDYVAPEIRAESDTLQVSVTATDEELLAGIVAEDNLDGQPRGCFQVQVHRPEHPQRELCRL